MSKKTVSDTSAKILCGQYLHSLGYTHIRAAKMSESCDLVAELKGEVFWVEIKYSSLKKGKFFGTVMLTELQKSLMYPDNFLFLVCRGDKSASVENWLFKLFSPREFWEHCTLTTPIFHYHLYLDAVGEVHKRVNYRPDTVKASPELIKNMWEAFQKWKNKT